MLSFLQPTWLWAIGGIIIPVAIHFWNISEGKALPVGSIALLEKSTKKYVRTLRISEWLLLVLRCLLIILIAMLLAKPVQQQKLDNRKGWLLLGKQQTNIVYAHFKNIIDSLLNAGFELHRFDESLEQTNIEDILASEDTSNNPIQYWPLLKKADSRLPPSFPVYVFTSNHLKSFKGDRPQVSTGIQWFAYSPDTVTKQMVSAWLTDENSIRVMLANCTTAGNMFDYDDLPLLPQQKNDYSISKNNGRWSVVYKNQPPVIVDTTVMQIGMYAGNNKTDANYIRTALEAIHTFTKRRLAIATFSDTSSVSQQTDWLFWLSSEALPQNTHAKNILQYAAGKIIDAGSIIHTGYTTPRAININKRITRDTLPNTTEQTIWKDAFGNPLLIKQPGNMYTFYSHFNQQWNNLAWSEAFPSILLQLIFEEEMQHINAISPDERAIDTKQILPVLTDDPKKKITAVTEDLSIAFWLIIFLLFCIERILSFKTKTITAV